MAHHAAGSVKYYIAVNQDHLNDLARIRQWTNLKVGFERDTIWIRDFDYAQIHSTEVKSIPFKTAYYEKENKLIRINNLLPDRIVPSVLWTPIDRALTVKLPPFNHNFFGIEERLSIHLVASDKETSAVALVIDLPILNQYISTAPSVRLEKIYWSVLESNKAILLGTPLLPLPGKSFWQRSNFLLPTGLDFDLHILTEAINKKINPRNNQLVIWNEDCTYSLLPKENLVPLSRGSFQLTMAHS